MGTIAAYFLYTVNVYNFGFKVLPFIFILILSSMWMGFFVSALIIRYGNKIQALAWSFSWMIAPFSAVYYPVSVLPTWAQWISAITPTSYMFEAARYLVATGNIDWTLLTKSLILSIILLALSLSYFTYAFKKRLESGILKLQ
jgi:ABC-2 type transport system permease protein